MNPSSLFAPIENRDLCLWFYFLSVLGFAFVFLVIMSTVGVALSSKKLPSGFFLQMFFATLGYGVFYLQNRLLYSMCVKSL
jgi:hypothetical protein